MQGIDITVVLNGHREGILAQPTLRSLSQSVACSRVSGISVEALLVLDRPDDLTREVFAEFVSHHSWSRILPVEFGDLGLSRNAGVIEAAGRWIAFLDADDLWGANWLSAALASAEKDKRPIVWHPELNIYFGHDPHIFHHVDMEEEHFQLSALAMTNCWTALCFASRQILEQVPYRATELGKQIGYEDWSWHLETISNGVIHKVVPGTGHAIRRKRVSLVSQTNAAQCMPRPSDLFRRDIETRRVFDAKAQ